MPARNAQAGAQVWAKRLQGGNKVKRKVLKDQAVDSALALGVALSAVFDDPSGKIGKAEAALANGVDKKCASLPTSPTTIFPGACADPDPWLVESCVIAAARCRACMKIDASDGLSLGCDPRDDRVANGSCP